VNPYKLYNPPKPINEIPRIKVILKICTLYKGKPHGMAQIKYDDPDDKDNSFKGVGVFVDGRLH
jgi:hypothetical protein